MYFYYVCLALLKAQVQLHRSVDKKIMDRRLGPGLTQETVDLDPSLCVCVAFQWANY